MCYVFKISLKKLGNFLAPKPPIKPVGRLNERPKAPKSHVIFHSCKSPEENSK